MYFIRFRFLKTLFIGCTMVLAIPQFAQVVSTSPAFPTINDAVTITFDATDGNAALKGFTGTVYAHTGVITNLSSSGTDWKYVQGTWGTSTAPKLTSIGGDKYTLTINDIRSFYGVPSAETVQQIAILFRDEAGSTVGRASDGSDIYIKIYTSGLFASVLAPSINQTYDLGETVTLQGESSEPASLDLLLNGVSAKTATGTAVIHSYAATMAGNFEVILKATSNGLTAYDTVHFVVNPTLNTAVFPTNAKLGINYTSPTTVTLGLYAPFKKNVYVIGDFNDWSVNTSYFMNRDPDGASWWIEISGLEAGKKYAFQYLVDGKLKIADPYSELVQDPGNDKWIDAATYPNPHPYPSGKTTGITTLLDMSKPQYNWQVVDFQAPEENELIVYELLVRDFVAAHNYKTLLDTLDYLEQLGINAIELMPVNEFEGNESWGYNPSFHMALDKYYGTPEAFKKLIDECHQRGIAIILDVVYNHAFSQSPLCQLYWDAAAFKPTSQNPFVNPDAKHDFNVGYDFNHENTAFKNYLKQVMQYWLSEYKVDGFRFDLSKGFTQKNTLGDVGAWGQYDGARVNNIKRIYSEVKEINPNAYVILEHFAENNEEKDLANYGCMFWGNLNHEATESAMGYTGNFSGAYHGNRGWNNPKILAYPESHDEERIMFKNLKYGNSNGDYTVKDINTALDRTELTWVVFSAIPGPKMMWQFQELGYDISIDQNGRTGNKPIKWEYNAASNRKDVYEVFSEMNKLKTTYDAFDGGDVGLDLAGKGKRVHLTHATQSFVVMGNFDVINIDMVPDFQHIGMWYEYFSGDSISVSNTKESIAMEPGEYMVWTDKPTKTDKDIGGVLQSRQKLKIYPNPAQDRLFVEVEEGMVTSYTLTNMVGQALLENEIAASNRLAVDLQTVASGTYLLFVQTDKGLLVSKIIK